MRRILAAAVALAAAACSPDAAPPGAAASSTAAAGERPASASAAEAPDSAGMTAGRTPTVARSRPQGTPPAPATIAAVRGSMCQVKGLRCLSDELAAAWWPAAHLLRPPQGGGHQYVAANERGGFGAGASSRNGSVLWLVLAPPDRGPHVLSHGALAPAGAILVQATLKPPGTHPQPVPPQVRTVTVRGRQAVVSTGRVNGIEGEVRVLTFDDLSGDEWVYWTVLDAPAHRSEQDLIRVLDGLR